MSTHFLEPSIGTLGMHQFALDREIAAPIDVVFESLLEQIGPLNQCPDGTRLVMTLEPWPGGRWFRDYGDNTGQLWGFVKTFVPNSQLELQGPMMTSGPTMCYSGYNLTEDRGITRIAFRHSIFGHITQELLDLGVNQGWTNLLNRVHDQVIARTAATR